MRNRTLSDLILALTIGLCVAAVSAERREQHAASIQPAAASVADNARSLALAVLWSGNPQERAPRAMHGIDASQADTRGPAERAMDRAAAAAGEAASSVEMPFFSFGSAVE